LAKDKNKKLEEEVKQDQQQEEVKEEEVEEIVEDINQVDEVEELKKQVEQLKNDYARAYADTENIRRRLISENELAKKYRIQSFAKEVLPILDNLERALKTEVKQEDQGFYKGVEMTYTQLINCLKNEGVEEIDCLNKPFDANFHQAIMQEKKEGTESGIVIEVLQKGYMLKDRILRPAMVKVSE